MDEIFSKHTIYVTKACNMECDYCYVKKSPSKIPSNEELRGWLTNIMSKGESALELEFIGGEPILNLNGIEFCCNYVKNEFPDRKVKFSLTTNGTILNNHFFDLVKKFHIDIFVSIDGTKFSHNMHRKYKDTKRGTYDDIIENALIMNEKIDNLWIRLTLTDNTIGFLYDSVKKLHSLGLNKITIGAAHKFTGDGFHKKYIAAHQKIIDSLPLLGGLLLYPMMEESEVLRPGEEKDVRKNTISDIIKEVHDEGLVNYYRSVLKVKNMWKMTQGAIED